jgi:rubrerythrin
MALTKDNLEAMELLAKNEETIQEVYKLFSQRFPDYQDFWSQISSEEASHANWIREISSKVRDGTVRFREGRFKSDAIRLFSGYLEDTLDRARREPMPLIHALDIALDTETALIERNFFDIVEGDSVEVKRILADLSASLKDHRKRILKAIENAKK